MSFLRMCSLSRVGLIVSVVPKQLMYLAAMSIGTTGILIMTKEIARSMRGSDYQMSFVGYAAVGSVPYAIIYLIALMEKFVATTDEYQQGIMSKDPDDVYNYMLYYLALHAAHTVMRRVHIRGMELNGEVTVNMWDRPFHLVAFRPWLIGSWKHPNFFDSDTPGFMRLFGSCLVVKYFPKKLWRTEVQEESYIEITGTSMTAVLDFVFEVVTWNNIARDIRPTTAVMRPLSVGAWDRRAQIEMVEPDVEQPPPRAPNNLEEQNLEQPLLEEPTIAASRHGTTEIMIVDEA